MKFLFYSNLQSLVRITTCLIGYFLFNERINKLQILGWIIMAIGLIIFIYEDKSY